MVLVHVEVSEIELAPCDDRNWASYFGRDLDSWYDTGRPLGISDSDFLLRSCDVVNRPYSRDWT